MNAARLFECVICLDKEALIVSHLQDSTIPTYQRMWQFMETTSPSVFTRSNMEGVERVQRSNGQYAFMMEMTSIEFFTERRCDLTQVGGALDSKGYGIAMRPGSPYRAALSQAVLKMQETNRLLILKNKWWKERRGGGVCAVSPARWTWQFKVAGDFKKRKLTTVTFREIGAEEMLKI